VIRRLVAVLAIGWALGFAAFALLLGRPLGADTTDAIVVPTGAAGRIEHALALLRQGTAHRLLITGVAPGVRAADLATRTGAPPSLFACCVDLGPDAVDTRGNARETARWVRAHGYHSIRIVTSDWHVARARMELVAALGPGIVVLSDGVPSEPPLGTLVNEYDKLILRRVALWAGW
jgi:uncharacterized SAM-binding protein YcdF (DUF218 family)